MKDKYGNEICPICGFIEGEEEEEVNDEEGSGYTGVIAIRRTNSKEIPAGDPNLDKIIIYGIYDNKKIAESRKDLIKKFEGNSGDFDNGGRVKLIPLSINKPIYVEIFQYGTKEE